MSAAGSFYDVTIPPMIKSEGQALEYASRLAYASMDKPPAVEIGQTPITAFDAWEIAADDTTPEAAFGIKTRFFVAPNTTSGYWVQKGARHIRRFPIPDPNQEVRDPSVNYEKPSPPEPSPVADGLAPDALEALRLSLACALEAVGKLSAPPAPTPTDGPLTALDWAPEDQEPREPELSEPPPKGTEVVVDTEELPD